MSFTVAYGDNRQAFNVIYGSSEPELFRFLAINYDTDWRDFGTYVQYDRLLNDGFLTDASNRWVFNMNGGDDEMLLTFTDMYDGETRFCPRFEINGGTGNDLIGGGYFDDILNGGLGADTMVEFYGDDIYFIDDPNDEIVLTNSPGGGIDLVKSSIDYSLPNFIENLSFIGVNDISGSGNVGRNTITGNSGDNVLDGLQGADTLIGGRGNDVYVVDSSIDTIQELANQGTDIVETSVSYTLASFVEQGFLNSAGRSQSLTGNGLANLLVGNAGNNTLSGLNGADELSGGLGKDTLFGGAGFDTLDGNAGADRMVGGDGNDLYYVDSGLDDVIEIQGADGGFDTVFTSVAISIPDFVEKLVFNGESDGEILSGNALRNFITGNYTDDIIEAGGGNDGLEGGSGNDTLDGGNGNDSLTGGFGSDWIDGGSGRDILRGGAGEDRFVFVAVTDSNGNTVDRIADFQDGTDKIDLRAIDAAPAPGNQTFTFIGEDADFDGAGQIRTRYSNAQNLTYIEVSIDSDDAIEMTIILQGNHNLQSSDFIL